MAGEVVVVPGDAEPDAGVAFAAGVAAAEAEQAQEDAAEAVAVAEAAAEVAEHAAEAAVDAVMTAERNGISREELDALRAEFAAGLEDVRGMIADALMPAGAAEEDDGVTPERIEREEDDQEEKPDQKKAGRYGNPKWFARR
jgi:hypothetical protein